MDFHIRIATSLDCDDIRGIHLSAFPEGENRIVAAIAVKLLSEDTSPETIALVAESDGKVVGHIAFSPVTANANKNWLGYILAPLAVKPECQKSGIGSKLVETGMKRLSEKGVNAVFVYGDPAYYGKFGFKAETAARFVPPYTLQHPFGWQATILHAEDFNKETVRISCVASLQDPELW